jgi:uncharacterized protein
MPDPFEALRTAPTPIDPEPAFAARLRARVARMLRPEPGELSMTMSDSTQTAEKMRQGDMSYVSLLVPDLERAVRFFGDVLGWQTTPAPAGPAVLVQGQSLQLGLAELVASTDYIRNLGVPVPATVRPTAYPSFVVDDIDAAIARVRAAGGFATDAVRQYGTIASCVDNQGLVFTLNEPAAGAAVRSPSTGARNGDLAYMTFEFPDASQARAFYGSVFDLHFEPGRSPDGWNVPAVAPMSGFIGGAPSPRIVPMFRVDDIAAAVQRVRSAGGTAAEPVHEGYGIRAACTDDQGVVFNLGQL